MVFLTLGVFLYSHQHVLSGVLTSCSTSDPALSVQIDSSSLILSHLFSLSSLSRFHLFFSVKFSQSSTTPIETKVSNKFLN